MLVNGKAIIKVDVSFEEAKKVVLQGLGFNSDYVVLEADDINNKCGHPAIYNCVDVSHHGSPCYEYRFVSDDDVRVAEFRLAKQLSRIHKPN